MPWRGLHFDWANCVIFFRLFHAESSWHALIFCGYCFWSVWLMICPLISLGTGSAGAGGRRQKTKNRKNTGERSEPSGGLGRGGKGGGAWRHAFDAAVPWYQILVPCSGWSNVFAFFQCHAPTIREKIFKDEFWASNINFFARLFAYPSAPRRATNMPVIGCKKKT